MSKNIEIEAKSLLTKKEYEKIISSFEHPRFKYQTNFYIDNKKFELSEKNLGLRIRKEKDLLELTMKENNDVGRLEINQRLSPNEFENFLLNNVFPKGEIIEYLHENYPEIAGDFTIFGTLNNQRLTVDLDDGELAIDHMSYFDHDDYEIECESSSMENAVKVLKEYLKTFGIRYKKNAVNKVQRVLNLVK